MKKFTHTGEFKNAFGSLFQLQLRETKRYWVDKQGTKYNKTYGHMVGEKYPMSGLVLSSIKMTEKAIKMSEVQK